MNLTEIFKNNVLTLTLSIDDIYSKNTSACNILSHFNDNKIVCLLYIEETEESNLKIFSLSETMQKKHFKNYLLNNRKLSNPLFDYEKRIFKNSFITGLKLNLELIYKDIEIKIIPYKINGKNE